MSQHTLLIFCLITLTQTFSIGPAVAILLSQYFNHGFRLTLPVSLAFRAGEALTLAAAFAITSLLHASPQLFFGMKVIGGAYLVFIGLKALYKTVRAARQRSLRTFSSAEKMGLFSAFLIPVINPKALIYFTSFIPSFIATPSAISYGVQFAILGGLFVLISFLSDMCFLLLASVAKRFLGEKFIMLTSLVSAIFIIATGGYFVISA